jgi:nitrogen fixation NifU-like protein
MQTVSLLAHFERPRNVGEFDDPDAAARAENPVCGDEVSITLMLDGDRIAGARYRAFGCHATIGTMSHLSERVAGMTLADARALRPADVRGWFDDFPGGKAHAADVAVEVLRKALAGRRQ